MACPRLALWLLARADVSGTREALVGDLMEEVARGCSRLWVWQQLIGLCWFALVAHARTHARITPFLVALVLAGVLLGGISISSLERVLETWVSVYLVAGTLSLFAHVMAPTKPSETTTAASALRVN